MRNAPHHRQEYRCGDVSMDMSLCRYYGDVGM